MEKVSIIVNSYKNNEDWLKASLKSLLGQDEVEVDLILSTVRGDSSINVANSLSNSIKIIENRIHGIYSQLNNALPLIDSNWFFYFSGNDVALSHKAINEINCCKKNNSKITYSAYTIVNRNLKNLRKQAFYPYQHSQHLKKNFVSDVALIQSDIVQKYGPFKEEFGNFAYWDFWLRVFEGEGESAFAYNDNSEWLYRVSKESSHIKRQKDVKLKKQFSIMKNKMLRTHL